MSILKAICDDIGHILCILSIKYIKTNNINTIMNQPESSNPNAVFFMDTSKRCNELECFDEESQEKVWYHYRAGALAKLDIRQ